MFRLSGRDARPRRYSLGQGLYIHICVCVCVCVCMWLRDASGKQFGGALTPSMALSATGAAQVFRITYLLSKRGKMFFSLKRKLQKSSVSELKSDR